MKFKLISNDFGLKLYEIVISNRVFIVRQGYETVFRNGHSNWKGTKQVKCWYWREKGSTCDKQVCYTRNECLSAILSLLGIK